MKRENKIALNIRLENNTQSVENIIDRLFDSGLINQVYNFKVITGRYKGKAENTLVIDAITSKGLVFCVDMVQRLCNVFEQECIAAKVDNNDLLIYAANYQGEKLKFDKDYFLTIKK